MNDCQKLPRRSFLALAAWSLASCGGGSSGFAGMPGTGGTGIYSFGSISGFGSVIVGGVKYDDLQAVVQIDGVTSTSADLRLGMVASILGKPGASSSLGIASNIEVWSIAQGAVSQVIAGQFVVAGMTIQTSTSTVLEGINAAAPLVAGQRVVVWGLQATADGLHWKASRVAVTSANAVVFSGLVSVVGTQRFINGLLLAGALTSNLSAGLLVRVQGTLSAAGDSLLVENVKLPDDDSSLERQCDAEIEGLVTSALSGNRFMLGSTQVDTSTAVFSPTTLQITVGAHLEVHGTWEGSVLKATKIEVEDDETLGGVEIEARITEFTSLSNFVVRSQRCDASSVTTVKNGTLADIKLGAKVHLKGIKMGDIVKVSVLEVED